MPNLAKLSLTNHHHCLAEGLKESRNFIPFFSVLCVFSGIIQNGCPGRREASQSISVDETSRIKSVWAQWIFGTF